LDQFLNRRLLFEIRPKRYDIKEIFRIIIFKIVLRMNRDVLMLELKKKKDQLWDIIVIGGGATGLGAALDGASRGYKTLLLEQADFAKGTSSRSTKLVHGGVRYLAKGDIFLVLEALHERGLILKNAPHLTSDQEFIIPVYTIWDAILYTVGLKFYDLLAGRLSMGRSCFIGRDKTIDRLPCLNKKRLKGGVVYHDGQFDDSRMALALAESCIKKGGIVLNYVKVKGFIKDTDGKIKGVKAFDIVTGEEFEPGARLVINAAGVFADDISRMDDPLTKPSIRPSQGIHIVINNSFLKSDSAIMIPKTDDGRVLFAIPWYDEIVVGTTDTPLDQISLEPVALEDEIEFILRNMEKYLVKIPSRDDILSVFAGLRPLAADPDNPASTRDVSRRHKISFSRSGLLTVVGGKWTTYRRMAQETIDRAIKKGLLDKRKCETSHLRLTGPGPEECSNRLRIYGKGSGEIRRMIEADRSLGDPVIESLPYTMAELIWICRNEMPVSIEDVLARRTRSLFLNARASSEIAPVVADLMAKEAGYDESWKNEQVELFRELVKNYI
jgi:glycerol-3-phosphate dehydrogenase